MYRGNWQDNKRNGHGKCEYVNGDIFDGEWINDKPNGMDFILLLLLLLLLFTSGISIFICI